MKKKLLILTLLAGALQCFADSGKALVLNFIDGKKVEIPVANTPEISFEGTNIKISISGQSDVTYPAYLIYNISMKGGSASAAKSIASLNKSLTQSTQTSSSQGIQINYTDGRVAGFSADGVKAKLTTVKPSSAKPMLTDYQLEIGAPAHDLQVDTLSKRVQLCTIKSDATKYGLKVVNRNAVVYIQDGNNSYSYAFDIDKNGYTTDASQQMFQYVFPNESPEWREFTVTVTETLSDGTVTTYSSAKTKMNIRLSDASPLDFYYAKAYGNLGSDPWYNSNQSDFYGIEMSSAQLLRQLFYAQELQSDNFVWQWSDSGLQNYNFSLPQADDQPNIALYIVLQKGVEKCNKYLSFLSYEHTAQQEAEIRTLRALYLYYLLDIYGNVPLYQSIDDVIPLTVTRSYLYDFIISELNAALPDLMASKARTSADADYALVDQDVANMLLARLYLNSEVYSGQADYAKAKDYAKKIIDGKHTLSISSTNGYTAYQKLFMGNNGENGASSEAILAVPFDGANKELLYGGTTFYVAATHNYDMPCGADTWSCITAKPSLPDMFAESMNGDSDDRYLFYSEGHELLISGMGSFYNGYAITKWSNLYTTGDSAHNTTFVDTDFFLMRSAEAYLIYAEADARLNGGTPSEDGLEMLNVLRTRANAKTLTSCSLRDLCFEWDREFYSEAMRRSVLIRFGQYTGSTYNWPWKGGELNGTSLPDYRKLNPIPNLVLQNNPNATQNPGY